MRRDKKDERGVCPQGNGLIAVWDGLLCVLQIKGRLESVTLVSWIKLFQGQEAWLQRSVEIIKFLAFSIFIFGITSKSHCDGK
jgi:hypothetical protein